MSTAGPSVYNYESTPSPPSEDVTGVVFVTGYRTTHQATHYAGPLCDVADLTPAITPNYILTL